MASPTCIIHLNGYPGTGKLTIAQKLCERENMRLIDNHASANLIFTLVRKDGKTKIPDNAWAAIKKIRDIVMESLPAMAIPDISFVFTHCLSNEIQDDKDVYQSVKDAAEKRGSQYIPVQLTCSLEENQRRMVSKNREERMKMTDPDGLADIHSTYTLLTIDHPNFMALDVTDIQPDAAANAIWNHADNIMSS